jgi:hypothetical protein
MTTGSKRKRLAAALAPPPTWPPDAVHAVATADTAKR